MTHDIGTIKDKTTMSKTFKYSLEIDQINIDTNRSGYLKIYHKNKFYWEQCWCVLSGTIFKICKSVEEDPLITFNLKYATYSKIDINNVLIFKYLRPNLGNDDETISKTRNNFVAIKLCFKAINLKYLELWMRDINNVVKVINDWNLSYVNDSELDF